MQQAGRVQREAARVEAIRGGIQRAERAGGIHEGRHFLFLEDEQPMIRLSSYNCAFYIEISTRLSI
jgi:hypothetical protein